MRFFIRLCFVTLAGMLLAACSARMPAPAEAITTQASTETPPSHKRLALIAFYSPR